MLSYHPQSHNLRSLASRISDAVDELESLAEEIEHLEDENEEQERELDLKDTTTSWAEWVERCIAMLPEGASVGDNVELAEILNRAVKGR